MEISLANEMRCEAFKGQFQKFDYLWTKDLQVCVWGGRCDGQVVSGGQPEGHPPA
jgi:dynein heavy chain